jgi:hypothetical protein
MSDRVEVTCPCCDTMLVVDAATGEVLSETRPKRPSKSFEDALGEVRGGSKRREDAFTKAFDRTQHQEDLLEKKFEEAKKKTNDEPTRPHNPMDLD